MAHSNDETALGKLLRNDSGSKSIAYQYDKHSKANAQNHQNFINHVIDRSNYLKVLLIVPIWCQIFEITNKINYYLLASSCDAFQVLDILLLLTANQFPRIPHPCPAANLECMQHSLPVWDDQYLQVSEAGSPLSNYQWSECSSCLKKRIGAITQLTTRKYQCYLSQCTSSLQIGIR